MSNYRAINDGLVDRVFLLNPRSWYLRWDVAPFFACYMVLFHFLYHADIYSRDYAKELANELEDPGLQLKVALIGIPVLLAMQVLLFLMSQWNMALKCNLGYVRTNRVADASMVHVVAAKNVGKDRIVPVMMMRPVDPRVAEKMKQEVDIAGSKYRCSAKFFEYQKVKYEYDDGEKNTFVRCASPNTGSVMSFLQHKGYTEEADVMTSLRKWGVNEFDIPVPPFLDLYMEHLTAPFFVFQMLCLFLWSLDDYWYYSAFTLLMLMFFEGMLCKQRLDGLLMLRQMRRPSMLVQVYRGQEWKLMQSEGLVPGDIVSLTTQRFEQYVRSANGGGDNRRDEDEEEEGKGEDGVVLPCDALIIRGSCVVNEAMLTGESVPQIKETLCTFEDRHNGVVCVEGEERGAPASSGGGDGNGKATTTLDGDKAAAWKRHLVFGGTTLLQDSPSHAGDQNKNNPSPCSIPIPAGGGLHRGSSAHWLQHHAGGADEEDSIRHRACQCHQRGDGIFHRRPGRVCNDGQCCCAASRPGRREPQ